MAETGVRFVDKGEGLAKVRPPCVGESVFAKYAGEQQSGQGVAIPELETDAARSVLLHVAVDIELHVLAKLASEAQNNDDRKVLVAFGTCFSMYTSRISFRDARSDCSPVSHPDRLRSPGLIESRYSDRTPPGRVPTAATSTPYCLVPRVGLDMTFSPISLRRSGMMTSSSSRSFREARY